MDDKTLRYDGTGPQENNPSPQDNGTVRLETTSGKNDVTEIATRRMLLDGKQGSEVSFISTRIDTFNLGDKVYQVVKAISETSGEAQVYLVENEGKNYVLKLYYPNFSPKLDLLKILNNLKCDTIVNLHDFGIMSQGVSSRCFELMEYLEGGSLDGFRHNNDIEVFKKIALRAASALYVCHNNGIIHKDVKLSNFFFRDKAQQELVLGDFGISSLVDESENLHRTTQARTPLYAAPEMYINVINGEVELTATIDFYSLGITLLHFWLGENPFTGNERSMMRLKAEGKLPNLDKLPEAVNTVIRGLTVVNPEYRWGYEEVDRWARGEDVPVPEDAPLLRYRRFIFDPDKSLVADNAKELAALMYQHRQPGIRYLFNKRISKWLEDSGHQKLSLEIDEIVEKYFPFNQSAGLMAAIYLLDPLQPFLPGNPLPTSTPDEIVKAFSTGKYTEDDLLALTDGRLLLWLSNKEEPLLYDQILNLTENETYSESLAYGVLYHLDRKCGFNLKEFTEREKVAELMSEKLIEAQLADDEQLPAVLSDFLGEKNKLYYYCIAHNWEDVLAYRDFCQDIKAVEEAERYGEYNLRIAAYKFCAGLGFIPGYRMTDNEQIIHSVEELEKRTERAIKLEFRHGILKYWLTIFYHEDPFNKFEEQYSYEHALEKYHYKVNEYLPTDYYTKRFITAQEQENVLKSDFRRTFRNAWLGEIMWFLIFSFFTVVLAGLIYQWGVVDEELFEKNYYVAVCAPIALFGIIMFALRAFYNAIGPFFTVLTSLLGGVLLLLPALAGGWLWKTYPEELPLKYMLLGLIGIYVIIIFIGGFRRSTLKVRHLRKLGEKDIETSLLEPLYFAYKTTITKFKSSDDGALTDGLEIVENTKTEIVGHYILWTILAGIFVLLFICFHPEFLGYQAPDLSWAEIKEMVGFDDGTSTTFEEIYDM